MNLLLSEPFSFLSRSQTLLLKSSSFPNTLFHFSLQTLLYFPLTFYIKLKFFILTFKASGNYLCPPLSSNLLFFLLMPVSFRLTMLLNAPFRNKMGCLIDGHFPSLLVLSLSYWTRLFHPTPRLLTFTRVLLPLLLLAVC